MAYSPEELYQLYGQSEPNYDSTANYDPTQQTGYQAPDSGAPTLEHPPGNITAPLNTSEVPQNVEQTPDLVQTGVKAGTSVGASQSVSVKGTPDAKISQRDRELKQAQAQGDAEAQAMYAPALAQYDQANKSAHEAAAEDTQAQVAKTLAEGRQAQVLGDIHKGFMDIEMKINAMTSAKEEQMKGDYAAALADFRASRPNPNQFFDNMGGGVRFGTLVTAFAHDFLGAQGIKTSAMETLKQGIDRNIDAQIQAIKIKGEALQGFKTLWEMQRAQSASEAEARTRVRGFMLEMTKQQLISDMSKYDSALVSAKGKQALAKLDAEYAKNVLDVYGHIAQNMVALRGQAVQWAGDKLKADAQNYATATSAKIHQDQQNMERQKMLQKAQQLELGSLIPDPSKSGGGIMKWRFRPGVGIDENGKVTELGQKALDRVIATAGMADNVDELRQMEREYKQLGPETELGRRFADTNSAKMRELQIKILADEVLRVTGKAATDAERSQIESRIPLDKFGTVADVEKVAAGFEQHGIEDLNRHLGTVATQLSPEEISAYQRGGIKGFTGETGGFAEGQRLDAKNSRKTQIEEQAIDKANKLTTTPGKFDLDTETNVQASKILGKSPATDWKDWWKTYNTNMNAPDEGTGEKNMRDQFYNDHKLSSLGKGKEFNQPPSVVTGIQLLASDASGGNSAAMGQLRQWAGLDGGVVLPGGIDPNSNDGKVLRSFALYEYSKIQSKDKTSKIQNPDAPEEEQIH